MIVVSNSTPLIGMASIQHFDILHNIFGKIHIPEAVYHETVIQGYEKGGAKREVQAADWLETIAVQNRKVVNELLDEIDAGEAEAIALAQELGADWVLMDERKGRNKLNQLNFRKIGTVGILVLAKQHDLLPVIRPELERLHRQGFSLSQAVIDEALRRAGEL